MLMIQFKKMIDFDQLKLLYSVQNNLRNSNLENLFYKDIKCKIAKIVVNQNYK